MHLEITDVRTVTDQDPSVREFEFRNAKVTLGSHSSNLIQLPDVEIAPYHATLVPEGDHWIYQPTTRDAQTRVNGQPVGDKAELHDGDIIEITHFTIKLTFDTEMAVELPEPAKAADLARIKDFPLPPRSDVRKADADVRLTAARRATLARLVGLLRECENLPMLIEKTLALLHAEFQARVVWMGVRITAEGPFEFLDGRDETGNYVSEPPKLETYAYRCLNRQQFISVPRTGDEDTQSVLAVPMLADAGPIGLLYVDSRRHTRVYDDGDLDFLTTVSAMIAPVFGGLLTRGIRPSHSPAESGTIDISRGVQAITAPRGVPQWPQFQVAVHSRAGAEKTGDVYDVMKLPNGLAAVFLATVKAEDVRSAALVAGLHFAFRVAGLHADPPHVQLKAMNWLTYEESRPATVDALILVVNPKTGAAEVAVAGKIHAAMVDGAGSYRPLQTTEAPALGAQKTFDYVGTSLRIQPGSSMALYTRGVFAAADANGALLNERRFHEALCDTFGRPASAALQELADELRLYFENARNAQDFTIALVHHPGK